MTFMRIERSGAYSQLQDLGRHGVQQYGVPVNGPMDEWSHRVANALVGNDASEAVLECTLTGPAFSFTNDTIIAITGADMTVTIDGTWVPMHRAVVVRRDTTITFGERQNGMRTYIAVRGGFSTEAVLGSRSTNVRAGFGGFAGRILQKGDQLPIPRARHADLLPLEKRLVQSGLKVVATAAIDCMPPASDSHILRVIKGPQYAAFNATSIGKFTSEPFVISSKSDRMGYRLSGPKLELTTPLEMISEATSFGTIQVPPDGNPIVLMADRQSAGGYPKIAYVTTTDIGKLAQANPGDAMQFSLVSQTEAEMLLIAWEKKLDKITQAARSALHE
jgi:antagonist of KipI